MVQEIEELGAKLQPPLLVEREVLEQGEIPVIDSRASDYVTACCPPSEWRGQGESGSVECLIDISRLARVRIADPVRPRGTIANVVSVAGLSRCVSAFSSAVRREVARRECSD